jgi:glycosyltransferase involved in cell wall biosynthesis
LDSPPRLRVAVDATSSLGVQTGIGRVTSQLLDGLARRADLDATAYAITWRGRQALADVLPAQVGVATRAFPARLTRLLWPRARFPSIEHWTGPVDVVHATNYVAPPTRAAVLVTVFDLTYAHFPELSAGDALRYPRLVQVAIDRGATVHTASDFVASEIQERYRLPPDRVIRIYPGLGPASTGDPGRGRTIAGSDRYILALGMVEPRKNLPRLVQAFDAVAARATDAKLVIAGPDGWGVEAFNGAVEQAHHRDRIRRLGWVDEGQRHDLLAGATVLAYPSLYEGFGLPPLEAMQAGTPVVAATAGALPEVLGDAALLPDPTDVDDIANSLTQVLEDEDLRRMLIQRGAERVDSYRWDRAVPEYVAAYQRLAAS